ncbi:CDP-glucose 4,6-dehydratase [Paenibacillus sp. JJ-100]|uniref:CDP-glucose 4,6-dehydratase n=1 Tax=Paenibacillus sp. JJ-100 TaxID=2974896 RepID=UPI0022FF6150|nr:CDP-glucose 4,6-dehydratase [Paenibacillus sp. JJ-100]CAI6081315.1 CDP-glucose 4,6-dehydratase [Paenibacillus sp. JJ-100]
MEMLIDRNFWRGKRVFVTGHTGFKGSWLSLWLHNLGAHVSGYSLNIPSDPSLFKLAKLNDIFQNSIMNGDITDFDFLMESMKCADPEIVIHMAAQPLVRKSYDNPIETYATNIMGTAHVMEAVKHVSSVQVVLNVTTDKCYDNQEWPWGYRETDSLGGHDPYSSSKACSELITSSYRSSFFKSRGIKVATARAGNVIGGGDWAVDRLIPDLIRALNGNYEFKTRNPQATRPWQHVLEPLYGYLLLCQRAYNEGEHFSQAWNFGPNVTDIKTVDWIIQQVLNQWPYKHLGYKVDTNGKDDKHEANVLKLDCSKANIELGWIQRFSVEEAISATVKWYVGYLNGEDMRLLCEKQISEYEDRAT